MTDRPEIIAEQVALVERQLRANRSTQHQWDTFESHREALTSRIVDSAPRGTLCLLGAGNCNDVDLERLARHFDAIHLVDLDEEAITQSRDRQLPTTRNKLVLHGNVDLCGVVHGLPRWKRWQLSEAELLQLPQRRATALRQAIGADFQCTVSANMLTQVQLSVVEGLGDEHPLFPAISATMLLTHLRTLASLTSPGGRALLTTELSSNLLGPLPRLADKLAPAGLLRATLQGGSLIAVSDPRRLLSVVHDDPVLSRQLHCPGPSGAWLWHQSSQSTFVVTSFEFTRR